MIDTIRTEYRKLWMYRNYSEDFELFDNPLIDRKSGLLEFVSEE